MSHHNTAVTQEEPRVGERVDLAEFALIRWWAGTEPQTLQAHEISPDPEGYLHPHQDPEAGQWHIGLEWSEPRDVRQVVVRYAHGEDVPSDLEVQYWRNHWPTPAPERLPGARRGWIGRDDPWHGQWTTVRAEKIVAGSTCTFTFDPIDLPELGNNAAQQLIEAEHYLARFRRTLKVRLVSGGESRPAIAALHAYSAATWQAGQVDVRFGFHPQGPADWSGQVEAMNGYVRGVEPLGFEVGDQLAADGTWRCQVSDHPKGLRLRLLYAQCNPASADRTMISFRTQTHSFSFQVADLDHGPIYIPAYGVLIAWTEPAVDLAAVQTQVATAPKTLYDRVEGEPEQSLTRAMAEMPPLDVTKQAPYGRYVPLGVEAGRQEWAVRYNGELFADKRYLKLGGRDAARLLWPGHLLRFRFGTGDPPDFREGRDITQQSLQEGWLPVVVSEWLDREIEYQQTVFAALLDRPMTGPEARRGDEDTVAFVRFAIRNTTHGSKRARLWLVIAPQEQIEVREGLVMARGRVVPAEPVARQWRVDCYEAPCLRCTVDTGGRGTLTAVAYSDEAGASHAIPTAVAYDVELAGGEAHTLTLAVPFVSLTTEAEWQQVAGLDPSTGSGHRFEARLEDVTGYWQQYIASGGQIEVPDQVLTDFHKAVRTHVAISVDKDPASGLSIVPAATWSYGACGNEAGWQITMLDQAGHHDRAEAYLETFLQTQGAMTPDGRFRSGEGAFQGLNLEAGEPVWGQFGYNLDHGVIMACLADHYRYTGDRAWLERVTPHLIAGCEFVIRERAATKVAGPDGEPVAEWGLLPAGHLEDNKEWRHWFAVNAHAHAGMKAIAEVLTEVGHPEGTRLVEEAAAYREDIRAAVRRAMEASPVVRLRDGTYVPHVPTRTGIRGREGGWFREAAYGALQLLEGSVFEPHEVEMTWVLKDLEDNLFVSRAWGRPVDLERYWFSHGGATIQPNLTDLGIDYLRRGQVKHALRALFNNFGSCLYPDVRVFAEHPVVELGHGVGPFYKASDESKALVWLRAFLLWEDGNRLHLAMGAPRAWFAPGQSFGVQRMASFFGPVTYRVSSEPAAITVQVEVPRRSQPQELVVHLRHPRRQALREVMVNSQAHTDFDPRAEIVRVRAPSGTLEIRANFD